MTLIGSDQAEIDFLKSEFSAPLDVDGFALRVPANVAADVDTGSIMTGKVDTPQEAQYLVQLAQGLNLDDQTVADIHQQPGLA